MSKFRGYTVSTGYCWKYCPYSTNYYNKYYSNGFAGPTNNPDIDQTNFTSVVTSDHPDTDGTMSMHSRGVPGWMCFDDNCQYFIDNGVRYFEI